MQVLIIDTDRKAADQLRGMLKEITDAEIRWVDKASKALFDVEEGKLCPEVCFIDLNPAEGAGGIGTAQQLLAALLGLQIIFMSAHDRFYLDAYEADHVWFLNKPVDAALLRKAWNRASDRIDRWESRYFSFRFNKKTYRIPLREILYFENNCRRIIVHTTDADSRYCFYGSMNEVMPKLDHHFIRCHNSYIVNLARVDTWSKTSFTIEKYKIPISRRYAEAAKAAFLDRKT